MFNRWWNEARLVWGMRVGRDRERLHRLNARLQHGMRDAISRPPSNAHLDILHDIRRRTVEANRNNITRTAAYLAFYQAHPEIHWAFLAHMVSRNGGWSMTDIKAEWFTRVSETVDGTRFFSLLERANWLIFSDAYPQLLLYGIGLEREENLSHLLGMFGVSRFMQVMWDEFWEHKDSSLITRAMIVNEQNFIESRVIQNWGFLHDVIFTLEFQVEALLGLHHVLFPYDACEEEPERQSLGDSLSHSARIELDRPNCDFRCDVRVAGTAVRQFSSLDDRIQVGKRLYSILFRDARLHERMLRWASRVPHTGSRSDMWPHLFAYFRDGQFNERYEPHFGKDTLPRRKVYSPQLQAVWQDVDHKPAQVADWFTNPNCIVYLLEADAKEPMDYTDRYIKSIQKIEQMIVAKEKLERFRAIRT